MDENLNLKRKKEILNSLYLLQYFTNILNDTLSSRSDLMSHVKIEILNPVIPFLLSIQEIKELLPRLHTYYFKWKQGAYQDMANDSTQVVNTRKQLTLIREKIDDIIQLNEKKAFYSVFY